MSGYGHLTYEERDRIALLRTEGLCAAEIGRDLGRHPGMIGCKLTCNGNADGGYRPASVADRSLARLPKSQHLNCA